MKNQQQHWSPSFPSTPQVHTNTTALNAFCPTVMQNMTRSFPSEEVRPKSTPNSCLLSSPLLCLPPEESQPQFSQFTALGSSRLAATLMGLCEEKNRPGGSLEALAARTPVGRRDPSLQGETTLLEITGMPVKLKFIYKSSFWSKSL